MIFTELSISDEQLSFCLSELSRTKVSKNLFYHCSVRIDLRQYSVRRYMSKAKKTEK